MVVAVLAAAAPAAVLVAGLRLRRLRAEVVEAVVRTAHPLTVDTVRDAVASILRDPGASVHYRPLAADGGLDAAFVRVGPPADGRSRRQVDVLIQDGSASAFLDADPGRRAHIFDIVAQACAPAMQNAVLHEAELARLTDVTMSRSRIVAAALGERRRLERDLHDGAQQRLLAVSARLGVAKSATDDPRALAAIDAARVQLRDTLSELRALAREVHPAVLEAAGLEAALEMSASRLGVWITVDPPGGRYPDYVETVVYLTVHEVLADAASAGPLSRARVDLHRRPTMLRVVVEHDGAARTDSPAVEHVVDRLHALGGTMHATGHDGAVSITVEVPCE